MRETTYRPAPKGLGTSYVESETPPEYARVLRNRFVNLVGGLEKRQGIVALGNRMPGPTPVTDIHELVKKDGTTVLLASGEGRIYRYVAPDWTLAYTMPSTARLQTVQMGDKVIFVNGTDRNIWTEDGVTFAELLAIIEEGKIATASTQSMTDSGITNWLTGTQVNAGDLYENIAIGGFGVITAVATASVAFTPVGSAATGIGKTTGSAAVGNGYRITDLVELNIIPSDPVDDNVAVATGATDPVTIEVSGVNFSTTGIRIGDIIQNTTRTAATKVVAIATALTVTSVASQTAGDSLVFYKSAMPVASYAHVHYGRLYLIDASDKRKVRISGANDPQDFSTDGATLDPISFNYELASAGDVLQAIGSFQNRIVFAGKRAVYVYSGTTPYGTGADFNPIGSFQQGIISPKGIVDVGNDLLIVTRDGMLSIRILVDSATLRQANASDAVRVQLRSLLRTTSPSDIEAINYFPRSFVMLKVGSLMYVYNYAGDVDQKGGATTFNHGTWSIFDGLLAQLDSFYVRSDGTLVAGAATGQVYVFDQNTYDDDGATIQTEYQTGYLTTERAREQTIRIKQGVYIKPLLEAGDATLFNIRADAGWAPLESINSTDSTTTGATATIGSFTVGNSLVGGQATDAPKLPLRWMGEVVRLTFTTDTTTGPDIIGRYTLYTTKHGRR